MRLKAMILGMTLLAALPAFAKEEKAADKTKRKPIDMQLELGGRMKYSFEGMEMKGYKPFEDLILPLNDAHATRFLKAAKDESMIAWPLVLAGVCVETVGVVDLIKRYDNEQNSGVGEDYTLGWVLFGGGALLNMTGALLYGQGQVDKFNAVKRYNAVVRGETQISVSYLQDHKQLALGLTQRF